jgi:thiamine-phosphate pyrophosphorylase
MIDANFNRAREAIRVLEDMARFGLDDAELSGRLKSLRHRLVQVVGTSGIDAIQRLASRDVAGDVGTRQTVPGEYVRESQWSVHAASASRMTEALRVIEETMKIESPALAAAVEGIRYDAYTLAKELGLKLGTGRARQWRLCVLLTESLCRHHPWEEVVSRAIEGGVDCVQLREKQLTDRELLARARRLVGLCREAGALKGRPIAVIVNDRPDIAMAAGADGVHLGQTDLPIGTVREFAGGRLLVGISTSSISEALSNLREGADYFGVGPMHETTTKRKDVIVGPAYLKSFLAQQSLSHRPHLAIGGIGPENVASLVEAGCRGVAVSSAVCGAEDPGSICRAIIEQLPLAAVDAG